MATLLNKLLTNGSTLTQFDGVTPLPPVSSTNLSRLHYTYSINGNPFLRSRPEPSQLDLNGAKPKNAYSNRPPERGIDQRLIDLTPPQ
jgi:hypothetical protein